MKVSYIVVLHIILLPLLIFFQTRGIVTHDEGYIVFSAEKIINGLVVYRDFDFVYTPLSILLTAFSFKLLGVSVLSSRLLMILLSLFSSVLLYKTVFLPTKNKIYATLAVGIFIAWGPSHLNFTWPVMFAIPACLLVCYALLKFLETRMERFLFLAGILTFIVFLTKQNFGVAILLPVLIFFLTKSSRKFFYIYLFSIGYFWGIITFVTYLLLTDSFRDFIHNLYFYTYQWIIVYSSLSTPFVYPDTPIKMVLRTVGYIFVPFSSIAAFVLLYIRRRFHLLFLPAFVLSFYVFGIRPTTDFVHIVPLVSLVGIPIGLYLRYNISTNIRILIFVLSFTLIIIGFYSALFRGYYRWDTPLVNHTIYHADKIKLFINSKFNEEFDQLEDISKDFELNNDYIYVDSFNPLLYFVTNTKEPMKRGYLGSGINNKAYYDEVLANLVGKEIKLVILLHKQLTNHPLKAYLIKHYSFYRTVQDFDLYIRKP